MLSLYTRKLESEGRIKKGKKIRMLMSMGSRKRALQSCSRVELYRQGNLRQVSGSEEQRVAMSSPGMA